MSQFQFDNMEYVEPNSKIVMIAFRNKLLSQSIEQLNDMSQFGNNWDEEEN